MRNVRIALVVALLALPGALALWGLLASRGLAAEIERSMALTAGYDRALVAAAALDSPAEGPAAAGSQARLRASLRAIDHVGGREDRRIVAYTRRRVREDSGRAGAAVQASLREYAAAHRAAAVAALHGQARAQDLELLGVVALGLLVFVLVGAPYVRRRQRSSGAFEQLERAALEDSLTRLRNHRAFHEDLAHEVERRNRLGGCFSLLMVDLDGLKKVNDTYGHHAGDQRIRTLAECLRATKRESDLAYRVGGDEFTLILPGERAWGAFEYAQRLRWHAESEGFAIAVGITETRTYESKDAVVRRADLAVIEAKRSNRSAVIYSDGLEPRPSAAKTSEEHHQKILATALARAVDAKDAGTRNHCETVAELCVMIGVELGLDSERLSKLRLAGLLHDVGKIGIADAILQKPAKLDEDESEVMRTHAEIGHGIVSAAELRDEAEWVLHHHERVDGTGYPSGLRREEILLESRVILVADTFEAITSDRPYRPGRRREEALAELERNAGTQFDAECVAALRRALALDDADEDGAEVVPLEEITQAA